MARGGVKLRLLLLLTLIAAGAGAWGVWFDAYSGFQKEVFVDFPRGTGTRKMASMLREAGVIRWEWPFLAARALQSSAVLKAGEYRFAQRDTPWHVLHRIAAGDIYFHQLIVPEGSNIFDISQALDRMGLMERGAFAAAARKPELVKQLLDGLAPDAPSLEGYLFPSTYRITRHTSPQGVASQMVHQFRKVWSSLGGNTDVHRTVTIASLVEKESAIPAERPLVASVYENRLEKGMKLDCDPTTIYAAMLEGRWRGAIYRSDLESAQQYNTYRNAGLPPGPIANPGLNALEAALHPAATNYLYFVARPGGAGEHIFNEGLAEHQHAVGQYRRGQQKAEPPQPAPAPARRTTAPRPRR